MSMPKKLMILGASILQLPAIETASRMGLQVIVLDMNPYAEGFKIPGIIKEVISTVDTEAAINAAKKYHIDGVMTLATDMPMRTVAAVARECGLVAISEETAAKATDKAKMREALAEAGVPIPRYYRVSNEKEYQVLVNRLEVPFMVKPSDSSGSRGIFKVENIQDVQLAYSHAYGVSRNGIIVVEEYMSGPEVSVETLAIDGEIHVIQITDKITTGAPHFVEIGHTQPTRLSCVEAIRNVAIAANKAIGIDNGPSHTEIIVTNSGPKVVELGARLGGDCITTHLVPLSTGFDMIEACIRIALGEKPGIRPLWNKGAAIRYFKQHAGTVNRISGLEVARNMPGIKQLSIVHGLGETITDIMDSGSRMGFLISQGDDAEDAALKCERALEEISVEEV